ncbi:MAG: ATP cone domain-containing protein [Candidatus Thorarchaeota archaeon]|jgi:hypothetical protein
MEVKKRDGSTEVYMPEKVVVSAVKCGCPYDTARDIASALSERSESTMESRPRKEEQMRVKTVTRCLFK